MTQKDQIVQLLKEKSVMKQDVFKNTKAVFEALKVVVNEICEELKHEAKAIDSRISVECVAVGDYQLELKVAGDMLVFYMHTNVFEFDKSHPMFKTGYIKENHYNSYSGIIYVYNFLADSFKYNRLNDLGYLISRIFINRESRFFAESKPSLGYKYQNFSNSPIDKEILKEIINELIIYCVSFDLFTPPAQAVNEISLNEIQERVQSDRLKTGKRLGFKIQNESSSGFEFNF
jgi:hypothetical protein